MKKQIKVKVVSSIIFLLLVSLACGAARDVIGTSEPEVSQPEPTFTNVNPPPTNQPSNPTEAPQTKVDVLESNWYTDSIGTLYFIGIIKNSGNVDLEFTEAIATLRDDSGTLVGSASSFSTLDIIRPGEISPFKILFLNTPANWTKYEIVVQGQEASFLSSYRDFEIVSSQGKTADFGVYTIVGEVKNIGNKDAEFVEIIAIMYDANGKIIGTESTFAKLDKVVAGSTSPFEVLVLSIADGAIDHYDLIVEGTASN